MISRILPFKSLRDTRNPVFDHDVGYGQAVLDVVARGRDLRLPVIAPVAGGSHDCLLAVGSIQQDPLFRGLPWHRKPARQRPAARPGPDGFQRLAPEPVVVNVSSDLHPYERTTPPIIESEFLQSNNRGSEKYRVLSL